MSQPQVYSVAQEQQPHQLLQTQVFIYSIIKIYSMKPVKRLNSIESVFKVNLLLLKVNVRFQLLPWK